MTATTSLAPFPYMGGKSRCLQWLYDHMPRRVGHFVDVFGGAANVVLGCSFADARTYNDINGELVNFFEVLRGASDQLITQLELTPHCRAEYDSAFELSLDPVEQARRTFIKLSQSFGRTLTKGGFSITPSHNRFKVSESTYKHLKKVEGLADVVEALRCITIENLTFEELITKYAKPTTYFYLDPPYLREVRTGGVRYANEFNGLADHERMVSILNQLECQGYMLSCYDHNVYSRLEEVQKASKTIQVNGGSGTRLETIYYKASTETQMPLFSN